ncbi:MAG: DinB family protein [Propionibacteriaceae bacterium]
MAEEPSPDLADPKLLMLGQLTFYRATLLDKLAGLSDASLRTSILPSGWLPLQLLKHLVYVERRWIQWGFEGEPVPDPWGDNDPDTYRWALQPEDTLQSLTVRLAEIAARTEFVVAAAELTDRGRIGGRFQADPPTLGWILLHLIQEYARHVGHLDIVRELLDGSTGE